MFSPRQMRRIRRAVTPFLVDRIRAYEVPESVYDPETMTSEPVPGDVIYDGKARVRPSSGPSEMAVGDSVMVMRDADFSLPHDAPMLQRDQIIKVVESEDPKLVDRWFRITDVTVASQQATRRCSGVQIQPTRLWRSRQ